MLRLNRVRENSLQQFRAASTDPEIPPLIIPPPLHFFITRLKPRYSTVVGTVQS